MKARLRVWPMKAVAALCLYTGLFPTAVVLGRLIAPYEPLLWCLPFTAAYLWGIAGYLLPMKLRIPFAGLGGAALLGWIVLFQLPLGLSRIFLALPCAAMLALLPPAWSRPVWDEWPAGFWIGCVIFHLLAQAGATRPFLNGIGPYLMPVFTVFLLLLLFSLNRNGLRDGMHGAEKAPAGMRKRNTALICGLFLIALAASFWGKLAEALNWVWERIRDGISQVIQWIMSLLPVISGKGAADGGGDMSSMFGEMDASEPSAFAMFMEKVAMVLAGLILLALVILAARALYQGFKRLWKKIAAFFRRYAEDADADYIDEAESTLNWEEKAQTIRDQIRQAIKRPEKAPPWDSLNGRERVRQLYRQFLRRRPDAKAKTAREALQSDQTLSRAQADAFTRLYEQARYSTLDIAEKEADELRKSIKA